MAYKGIFKPKHPEKYAGDLTNIQYRSRWELIVMQHFDHHPDVITWSSEECIIPYISPVDNRRHRYFPDFVVKLRDKDGQIKVIMIEVKPAGQVAEPKKPKSSASNRRYLTEVKTWSVNQAKWAAAREFCADKGWQFIIVTEHDLKLTF
jgi:hypothetical protein